MSVTAGSEKQTDDKKGDEVLRRMLKTPPDPKAPPKPKPGKGDENKTRGA